MLQLRPYQNDGVNSLRQAMINKERRILYTLPTGGGKTVIFTYIAKQVAYNEKSVMILVHRQELLKQTSAALRKFSVRHGLISPQFTPDINANVQVASVQTVIRRLNTIKKPDLIIIDEAHHATAGSWRKVIDFFPEARVVGVTATPVRTDGRGLSEVFTKLIIGPQISELIKEGYLVAPRVFSCPDKIDFSQVKISRGDYDKQEVIDIMDRPKITGNAVSHYHRICPGTPAVVFCVSVNHAENVAQEFRDNGYRSECVHGDLDDDTRDKYLKGLGNGSIQVITSCDLISEGTDIPKIGCAILLRPTQSLGLYMQQVGRALRPALGKSEAIVLDHVGNVIKHGMPDDAKEWTLEGRKKGQRRKRNQEPDIAATQCNSCYAVYRPAPVCPHCGAESPKREKTPQEIKGELIEIQKVERAQKRQEQAKAETLEDLLAIAKKRGYKPGWARHIFESRQKK